MGSFIGHAVPGSFFMFIGVWWMAMVFRRMLQLRGTHGKTFHSSPSLTGLVGRYRLDPEGMFAIFAAAAGMMIELRGIYLPSSVVRPHNTQHATMYFFFGIMGFLGVLREKLERHLPNVVGLQYICLSLCFAVEALLFSYHLFGRDSLDVTVHTLLINTAWLCALCCLIEMWKPKSVIPVLCRAFLVFVQGTWFWQVAFILYNPIPGHEDAWDHEDHHQIMLIACIFTWHVGVALVGTILLGILLSVCYERRHGSIQNNFQLHEVNGYAKLLSEAPDIEITE